MINENHFDWRHRYFTELLLEWLKKKGFDLIGFETLGYDDSLNQRKYANYYSGYYSRESQMSNLIRTSAKKGFDMFSYEDTIFDTETS
jgi:kynurenine formamidase